MNNEIIETLRAIIKEELTPIHERLEKIDERFGAIESKLDGIIEQVAHNTERINDVNEVVLNIKTTQDQHERTLDLLSRRSIDQEAELKRIK